MAETRICDNRLEWIDWMKALGIYLIILGHFYSIGEKIIYAFHVPLFFVISGFLNKKEANRQLFWKKLWYNLAVPMLLLAVINCVYHFILQFFKGLFSLLDVYWFVRNLIFGMVAGLDSLWFVYTLILLKVIYQFCHSNVLLYWIIVVMLALAFVYNHIDFSGYPFFLNEPNAFIDMFTAYPFFTFGVLMRNYKVRLNVLNNKLMLISVFVCGLFFLFWCSTFNGYVAMFRCCYGGNIFLFLVGAIAGTVTIWAMSKLFGCAPKAVVVISRGTIIILGFHKILIDLVWTFYTPSVLVVVFAILILLLLIPIVIVTENYFPLMAGKYRINNRK